MGCPTIHSTHLSYMHTPPQFPVFHLAAAVRPLVTGATCPPPRFWYAVFHTRGCCWVGRSRALRRLLVHINLFVFHFPLRVRPCSGVCERVGRELAVAMAPTWTQAATVLVPLSKPTQNVLLSLVLAICYQRLVRFRVLRTAEAVVVLAEEQLLRLLVLWAC